MPVSADDLSVRLLGQLDLGAAAEVLTGELLWSRQKMIAKAVSRPRAKVAVPSCNASGKTWLGARIALAFYNAFTPGTPCVQCDPDGTKGGCRGAKVILTSSKQEHLFNNLGGELRSAYPKIAERGLYLPGKLFEGDLKLEENKNHFIIGQVASSAEGMQGYHAAHKLILGDEATSVDEEVQLAITRLLASSDSRILLIYNPTTPDTYASKMNRSASFTSIPITAWDTPHFTNEPVPPGSNLITPAFLQDLKDQGMGPGTFEWQTSIEARDWDRGDDLLIPSEWYINRSGRDKHLGERRVPRQLGIDIAAYGSDENVVAVRVGNQLVEVRALPSMRTDALVQGPVTEMVMDWDPDVVVFDGDGVGAGAIGYFEDLKVHMRPGTMVIPFRGGKGHHGKFLNQRAAWYWLLRRRFEAGGIDVCINDDKLHDQLTDIHYSVTPTGDIRVEAKSEMRKRGMKSPDRGDAVMYAFAYVDDFPLDEPTTKRASDLAGEHVEPDMADEAMWARLKARYTDRTKQADAVLGVPDWL